MNALWTNTDNNLFTSVWYKSVILVLFSRKLNFIFNTCAGFGIFRAELYEEIGVSGGRIGLTVVINPLDLAAFIGAQFADLEKSAE